MTATEIALRGVHVHNLKHVDLDIPHQELVVFCGVSGSGKTSLALDTLYAEGQRRYIESFSAYTRQFLEQLPKPAAESITGIPPAIAVTHKSASTSNRATVGTATEIVDYLRLLFAKIGEIHCHGCGRQVQRDSAETAAERLSGLAEGERYMVAFPQAVAEDETLTDQAQRLREDGFIRWIVGGKVLTTDQPISETPADADVYVVVDRLTAGGTADARVRESLETAMAKGDGRCHVFVPCKNGSAAATKKNAASIMDALFPNESMARACPPMEIDGKPWVRVGFSDRLVCEDCGEEFPRLEPRLFSFNSPLGACPECEGFGNVMDVDMDLIVPNPAKSISEGAIAPWNSKSYKHHKSELEEIAADHDLPLDIPFHDLTEKQVAFIRHGDEDSGYEGLDGFFAWLEKRKYKMHIRVYLSRWRSFSECPTCHGMRLRPEALATTVGGKTIADLCKLQICEAGAAFEALPLTEHQRSIAETLLEQVETRLHFLNLVGLGYLSLDRTLRTLSCGEAQRVALTSTLGSNLVNMLYVLDEPSVGLHPQDVPPLLTAITNLRDRGNTVVLVEHEDTMISAADHVIEVGPEAGEGGGEIIFEGTPEELLEPEASHTGEYITGRRGNMVPESRRTTEHGWIKLRGATGNNLKNVDADFPLGNLCLVTGVSGAGKSTLIQGTLFPALCRRKKKESPRPYPYTEVLGAGKIEDVLLIDQSPIGRSPRSNPVTYIKAFDAIRGVFADSTAAKTRNFKASHFSFNVDGGRCEACNGDGSVAIDMQFLADVVMVCGECRGKRYRREVLEIEYRGQSIADVLSMTVRQAKGFFRGQDKVQSRLQPLIDVGLDYLRLGQAANTLSAGEAQRLKLAGFLSTPRRGRTLFLMDEPTTGLHFSDIVRLLDCFDALIEMGHSLVVVEHNVQMMQAADYIIEVGPGAAEAGGEVVACGSPEEVAKVKGSATGQVLKKALKK